MDTILEIETRYDGEPETLTFASFPVRVGRDETCELYLPQDFVSRRHARIERHGESFVLIDERSRNGLSIDGEKLPCGGRASLVDGTVLAIEGVTLCVRMREQTQPMARPENMTSLYADEVLVPDVLARASAVSEAVGALGTVLANVTPERRTAIIRQLAAIHPEVPFDRWWETGRTTEPTGADGPTPDADASLREVQRFATAFGLPSIPATAAEAGSLLRCAEHALRVLLCGKVELDTVYGCEVGKADYVHTAAQLGTELLDWRGKSGSAVARIEQRFVEILSHHVRLVGDVREAIRETVEVLSPGALQAETPRSWWSGSPSTRALWEKFTRRHAEVAASMSTRLGPRFARVANAVEAPSVRSSTRASTSADRVEEEAPDPAPGDEHWPFAREVRWELHEGRNLGELV